MASELHEFWRVNNKPNEVNIDVSNYEHDFDPKQQMYDGLMKTALIKKLNEMMDLSFIINAIINLVGYTESTLDLKSHSNFWCSANDVEHLFIISLPKNSKFNYKLVSFATHIRLWEGAQYCATLLLWDVERLKANKNDIIWQSKIFTPNDANFLQKDRSIVLFDNINVMLDTNKVYAIKIDVPKGLIGCDLIETGEKDRSRVYFVNSNGHLEDNVYRMKWDRDGKLYQIVFE